MLILIRNQIPIIPLIINTTIQPTTITNILILILILITITLTVTLAVIATPMVTIAENSQIIL